MASTPTLTAIMLGLGRWVLASLFVLGGLNKLMNYSATQMQMGDAGLLPALLPLVIALELGGGLAVGIGRRLVVPAAAALAVFTLATNLFFHDFWTMTGDVAALELSLFFKNLSIAGGLLYVAAATYTSRQTS